MAAALSRPALLASAPPLLDRYATATAPSARLAIPRCLKAAISSRRTAELRWRLAAITLRPSTTASTTNPPSSSLPPPPPTPPPPPPPQQHPLDAEASDLRHALSNRGGSSPTTDPLLLDRARDLALSLAAARRGAGPAATPEASSFLDALAGAVARALEQQSAVSPSIWSLEASARLVKAYAQSGHVTLATSELVRACVRQACRALTAGSLQSSPLAPRSPSAPPPPLPPPVPVFAAASSIARSVSCLGIYPGARLMEALSASAVAFAAVSVRGSGSSATDSDSDKGGSGENETRSNSSSPRLPSRLPASAVVDWLCAAAAAKHALPRAVSSLAATARFNPIQAATAAAALASLGSTSSSSLVSTLRSRVAGSPRGGVPPRVAVAAAWALASWGRLDASAAAALAEHAEAGIEAPSSSSSVSVSPPPSPFSSSRASNPSLLREGDLVSMWAALRVAGWRGAAAAEAARTEGESAGAEEVAAAPVAFPAAASARATRAASAARAAAAVAAAAEVTARGPPREISKLSERLLLLLQGRERKSGSAGSVVVLAPSADNCMLWRVQIEVKVEFGAMARKVVALVALSPRDNTSSNFPAVSLGLASVELNVAAAALERGDGDGDNAVRLCFRGLVFAGDGDAELEALAAAVEEALLRTSGGASSQPLLPQL